MISVVSFLPDVDMALVQAVRDFLNVTIGWAELYPKYGTVRVSSNHPFVELLDQQVNGGKLPSNLFPSVTIASVQDSMMTGYTLPDGEYVPIQLADLQEIDPTRGYLISPSQLTALENYLQGNPQSPVSKLIDVVRTHAMALEIWADNLIVKNKLFDLIVMALSGPIRFALKGTGITIKAEEIRGQRTGNYNTDFGKLYYGANINFSVDVDYWQIAVDTGGVGIITDVLTNEQNNTVN